MTMINDNFTTLFDVTKHYTNGLVVSNNCYKKYCGLKRQELMTHFRLIPSPRCFFVLGYLRIYVTFNIAILKQEIPNL